jgi:ferredoxin
MAKLKIVVDADECTGCGLCCDEAPATFELNDDSIAEVKASPGDDEETILNAARSCPVDAIVVTDEDSGKQLCPE